MVAVLVGVVVMLTCRVIWGREAMDTLALAAVEELLMELPTLAVVVAAGEMAHSVKQQIVAVVPQVVVLEVLTQVVMPRLTEGVEVVEVAGTTEVVQQVAMAVVAQ